MSQSKPIEAIFRDEIMQNLENGPIIPEKPNTEDTTPVEIHYNGLVITYSLPTEPIPYYETHHNPDDTPDAAYEIQNLQFADSSMEHSESAAFFNPTSIPILQVPAPPSHRANEFVTIPGLGKKEQQFILLHEIGHSTAGHKVKYPKNRQEIENFVAMERSFDEYAVNTIRSLRARGIDLEPEISDDELDRLVEENAQKRTSDWLAYFDKFYPTG